MSIVNEEAGAIERKRVFKFYKSLVGVEAEYFLGHLDASLHAVTTTITSFVNSEHYYLKESFTVNYNLDEDFFILRDALSDVSIEEIYTNALFDWPPAEFAKSNLTQSHGSPTQWLTNFTSNPDANENELSHLRWVTLGYHYDWTNKVYPENCEAPFPRQSSALFKSIANVVASLLDDSLSGGQMTRPQYASFVPQAAIINYYRKKTTMGFHVDQAEVSKTAPLISISMGRPALFLLEASCCLPDAEFPHGEGGGRTIVPVVLRHGDVIITGGHSRLAYHAVPRLLPWDPLIQLPPNFFSKLTNELTERLGKPVKEGLMLIEKYVCSTRLNMNVRQVYDY